VIVAGARLKYEIDTILEAARLFPGNVQAAAEHVGCTDSTIDAYMQKAGLPIIPRRSKVPKLGVKKVDWNAAAILKLKALIDLEPRPSIDQIAAEMQCSRPALHGIMSKLRLSFRDSKLEIRSCMCSERSFGSEGIHDRLCNECGNSDGEIDTSEHQLAAGAF
jgi:hypothetical protein